METAARALQDATFGQDTVALLVRQHTEPEELAVELDPVVGPIATNVLHYPEPVQARQRWRMRIGSWNQYEIHVVDRKVAIAIDKVNATRTHAMDRRNIELHHFHVRRRDPRAAV